MLEGFHVLKQNIYTLITEFLTDFTAEIAEFLDLDNLKASFRLKTGCEVTIMLRLSILLPANPILQQLMHRTEDDLPMCDQGAGSPT